MQTVNHSISQFGCKGHALERQLLCWSILAYDTLSPTNYKSPLISLITCTHLFYLSAHRPVPVTSDVELSIMKNKIAELKAQLNKDAPRERSASSSGDKDLGFTFVSLMLQCLSVCSYPVNLLWLLTFFVFGIGIRTQCIHYTSGLTRVLLSLRLYGIVDGHGV